MNSPRAKFWDYGSDGSYFITICTREKKHFFGNITEEVLVPSEMGLKAEFYQHQLPVPFPFVELDFFALMPNHLQGILGVYKSDQIQVETRFIAYSPPEEPNIIKTAGRITETKNPMGKNGLPEIIRCFKGRSSFGIRKTNPAFGWQSGCHDMIIQDSSRYEAGCHYIVNKPEKWQNLLHNPH